MLGQHRDGPVRFAGESEFLELPVFGGQVALVIVGEDPVPPAVELRGALAKLRYSPYLAECSGLPGMIADHTRAARGETGFTGVLSQSVRAFKAWMSQPCCSRGCNATAWWPRAGVWFAVLARGACLAVGRV